MEFHFGKYQGEEVAYVGIIDYPYFDFLAKKCPNCRQMNEINKVRSLLNNFVPKDRNGVKLHCSDKDCKKEATHITIYVGSNYVTGASEGVSAGAQFIWCREHAIEVPRVYPRIMPHPIGYDTLLRMPPFPKYIRKDVADVLLELTGWDMSKRKIKNKMVEHVNNLEQICRTAQPGTTQLRLF